MERQWDTQKNPRGGKGWQSGEPCAVEGSRGRRAEGQVSPQCPPCLGESPQAHGRLPVSQGLWGLSFPLAPRAPMSADEQSCSPGPATKEWAMAWLVGALGALELHDKGATSSCEGSPRHWPLRELPRMPGLW